MNMKKFVIYARKSTESEDRQVLSIDSQIAELNAVAERRGFTVSEVLRESMSAKAPGRPIFNALMARAEAGELAGILCWKLDRLARNPVDGGRIIWSIKQQGLKIVTPSQSYAAEDDNVILMYVEFGMAQKYIDDLGKNVRRGIRAKLDTGWLPGNAPLGYLNKLDDHTIIPDPDRFPLVRRMWDMMLTGTHAPRQICRTANEEWGFRTKKTKRQGGTPLSLSTVYKVLNSPFYYGIIRRKVDGEHKDYQGSHTPMVTEEEFWRVQRIMGKRVPRMHTKAFPLTGLIRCGECGAGITAEEKVKQTGKRYVYYRCTKKGKSPCAQKPITAPDIEAQFNEALGKLVIPDSFKDWALRQLRSLHETEAGGRTSVYVSLQTAYNDVQTQMDKLTTMRLRDLLTDEEYMTQKNRLLTEQRGLREKMGDTEQRAENWLEKVEKSFDFACHAQHWFTNGSIQDKRQVAVELGSNYILKDGKLDIQMGKMWDLLTRASFGIREDAKRIELTKNSTTKGKTAVLAAAFPRWQGR